MRFDFSIVSMSSSNTISCIHYDHDSMAVGWFVTNVIVVVLMPSFRIVNSKCSILPPERHAHNAYLPKSVEYLRRGYGVRAVESSSI